jgi:hypothetical protein
VIGLLAVEVLLWLSERFGWIGWHKGYAALTAVASVGVAMLGMFVWFGVALVFRRRFQFSIRSLLALTVAVALPCGWLAVEMKKAEKQRQFVVWVVKVQGLVRHDYELTNVVTPGPNWLRALVGKDLLSDVVEADLSNHYEPGGRWVWDQWGNPDITDADLEQLNGLTQLKEVQLDGTSLTDEGVAKLQQALPNCKIIR